MKSSQLQISIFRIYICFRGKKSFNQWYGCCCPWFSLRAEDKSGWTWLSSCGILSQWEHRFQQYWHLEKKSECCNNVLVFFLVGFLLCVGNCFTISTEKNQRFNYSFFSFIVIINGELIIHDLSWIWSATIFSLRKYSFVFNQINLWFDLISMSLCCNEYGEAFVCAPIHSVAVLLDKRTA